MYRAIGETLPHRILGLLMEPMNGETRTWMDALLDRLGDDAHEETKNLEEDHASMKEALEGLFHEELCDIVQTKSADHAQCTCNLSPILSVLSSLKFL